MIVDYQVLTFKNKIKPKDIGGLGIELNDRKGSGNYDKERTKFNIEYVGFDDHPTLSSKVYKTIYTNNILLIVALSLTGFELEEILSKIIPEFVIYGGFTPPHQFLLHIFFAHF